MLNSEKMLASLQSQDLAHADKYFQKALREDPVDVLLELAEYLESIGFLPHAKQIYEQICETFPETNINLAQIAAEDGEVEQAFLYLDRISEESPDYLSALLVMADLYQMEGLTDVARDKLYLASQLSDDPIVIFGLAEMEYELEDYQSAIKHYAELDNRAILKLTGVSTYQRIGRSYANLGKFEAAIDFLSKALEIEYDDTTAFELAVIFYDQEDYQKANFYFKQLDTMSPDFSGYEYAYALSLQAQHQSAEALRLAQKGLSKNAFDSQLLLLASQLSYETHDKASAISYLLSAKDVMEDIEEVLLRLSTLYLEEEAYDKVIALDSEEVERVLTKWNIAKAYQALDRDDRALELYRSIASELKANPEFLQDYIYLLRQFGYRDEVRDLAKHYLKLVPDDVNMLAFMEEM